MGTRINGYIYEYRCNNYKKIGIKMPENTIDYFILDKLL